MKLRNQCSFLSLTVCLAALVGCGPADGLMATDEQHVLANVEALGDMAGDDESFASAFVPGSVPENRKDYAARGYQVNGEATFDGDTATVPVKIFGVAHPTGEGDRRGKASGSASESEQTWTLQRIDDKWKLQDAPLG